MSSGGSDRTQDILGAAVLRILRPLVRVLLRHGVPFRAFADLAKRAYVDVAESELRIGRRKQTVSRIAVLTGLTRKEVRRIRLLPAPSAREEAERYNRAARVITGWATDPQFHDEDGQLRPLHADSEFAEAVRRFSGDMPSRAVLDELVRVGAVSRDADDRVGLNVRAYVPGGSDAETIEILGSDVAALAETIDHNMNSAPAAAWFQRKVLYDNLPEEALPLMRELSAREGQRLLELLNTRMRRHDRDTNPEVRGKGRKTAMVGIYYYEGDTPQAPEALRGPRHSQGEKS